MRVQLNNTQLTIDRTIKTALLVDAFWQRWIVHGVDNEDLDSIRSSLTNLDQWVRLWADLAEKKVRKARGLEADGIEKEAEIQYQEASLYYNLLQWIFPDQQRDKLHWYDLCQTFMKEADRLSPVETLYVQVLVNGQPCYGRIRIPSDPEGAIIIVSPIDSSKEELVSYEKDFNNQGMMTICFDGPGQGETFVRSGLRGNQENIQLFINGIIDYTRELTTLPIYLFGTSSGGAWAVYGGSHPSVAKVVAVSPTDQRIHSNIPAYFNGRLSFMLDEFELVRSFHNITYRCPVLLYYGKKDAMVASSFIDELYNCLPEGKKVIYFEDEGHCCNNKLNQILRESIIWLKEIHS